MKTGDILDPEHGLCSPWWTLRVPYWKGLCRLHFAWDILLGTFSSSRTVLQGPIYKECGCATLEVVEMRRRRKGKRRGEAGLQSLFEV
jgi:hypothetical protein